MEPWVVAGASILVLGVVIHHVLTGRENARLYNSLQEAYRALEEQSRRAQDYTAQLEQLNDELEAVQSELIRNNRELVESRSTWERLAVTDMMTEIANRRAFLDRLREEISRAQRYNYPFILLMLDVDNFKPYNDTFGHPAGDRVLKEVATLLRESVREGDLVARYGGEEFAALLTQSDRRQGRVVAERIRDVISRHQFSHRPVTVSIGVAEFMIDGRDPEMLLSAADRALYRAKRSGKNRIIFVQDMDASV